MNQKGKKDNIKRRNKTKISNGRTKNAFSCSPVTQTERNQIPVNDNMRFPPETFFPPKFQPQKSKKKKIYAAMRCVFLHKESAIKKYNNKTILYMYISCSSFGLFLFYLTWSVCSFHLKTVKHVYLCTIVQYLRRLSFCLIVFFLLLSFII